MYLKYCMLTSFILTLLLNLPVLALTQAPAPSAAPRTASISGRVTIGNRPVVGRKVLIAKAQPIDEPRGPYLNGDPSEGGQIFSAVTDADGQYRLTGLPAGSYEVSVRLSGAYVLAGQPGQHTRNLLLEDGKEARDIDFTLVRGGAITGHLTDANGRSLAGAKIQVDVVKEESDNRIFQIPKIATDDRGIYRVYGLPSGRYRVSADGTRAKGLKDSVKKYSLTYHPDTTDERKATVIEVKEGSEANDVNIKLAPKRAMYEVTGRIFEADTGNPVPQAGIYCFGYDSTDRPIMNYASRPVIDSQGRFRFAGLPSGRYTLDLEFPGGQSEYYYERSSFEVKQENLSGIEVKLKKGATINGLVIPIDNRNPSLRDQLSQIRIAADTNDNRLESAGRDSLVVDIDGSFRLSGIPPGTTRLRIINSSSKRRFYILRIERDGVDIQNGMEVKPGETITGVRMIVAYGTGAIRGQVKFVGGTPPEGMRFVVSAYNEAHAGPYFHGGSADVDNQGQFVIEGLMEGEYQVTAGNARQNTEQLSFRTSQRVRVTSATQPRLTMTIDLSKPKREGEQ